MAGPIVLLPYRDDELNREYRSKLERLLAKPRLVDVNAAAEIRSGGDRGGRDRGTSSVVVGDVDGSQWDNATIPGYLIPDDPTLIPRADTTSSPASYRDIGFMSHVNPGVGFQASVDSSPSSGFQADMQVAASNAWGFEGRGNAMDGVKLFYAAGSGASVAGYTALLTGAGSVGVSAVCDGSGSTAIVGTLTGTAEGENDTYSISAANRIRMGNWLDGAEQVGAPATPPTGYWRAYFKSDGMYVKDDAGAETGPFSAGGGSGLTHGQVMARVAIGV